MKSYFFILSIMIISCNMPDTAPQEKTVNDGNPFFVKSTLPFETIPFDKIKEAHFKPAFEKGMTEQVAEIDRITKTTAPADFENTVVALERSGQLLERTNAAFGALTSANTNETLQAIEEEMAPRLGAHTDTIYMNPLLFSKVDTVYRQLDTLSLDPESKRLVGYYHQKFLMSGAGLPDSSKAQLKKLNESEALLTTKFSNQLLAAAKAATLYVAQKEELAGLSEEAVNAAADLAKTSGKQGFGLGITNTTQQPALQQLGNAAVRKKLFDASWSRAEKGDSNDTRAVVLQLAQIRKEKAALLGFPNYAAWKLQDQMAKTPEAVTTFLNKLIPASKTKSAAEAEAIRAVKEKDRDTAALVAADWDYYAEKVRKAMYELDESRIRSYFVLDSVLKNGVFYAATRLYGITFKERTDLPVYQEDVRVYEVVDHDGTPMALFYTDFFKRDNKNGGAWMNNFVPQSKLLNTKPVIVNVCNYTKPAAGEPALLSFDEVITMFHEFGHTLHGLFANQTYPSLSGTNVARDFVELPSQFNEHWALDTAVLTNYAKHFKTGEVIPQSLISKIKNAATFNQGYALMELLAAAQLDMQWHSLGAADSTVTDIDRFEQQALERTGTFIAYIPPRYRSSYFLHIWAHGYAAGYYAYSWAEMLDHDAFAWFQENGGLTRANGQRFRDMILSKGNTEDLAKVYRAFRGKDPEIQPLLANRGLVPAGK